MDCPNCKSYVSSEDKFCRKCGASIVRKKEKADRSYGYQCPICKTYNHSNIKYCVKCGHWMLDTITSEKPVLRRSRLSWVFAIIFIVLFAISSSEMRVLLSFLLGITGLISIIIPLPFLGIRSRVGGVVVLLIGVSALLVSAAHLLPDSDVPKQSIPAFSVEEPFNAEEYKEQCVSVSYEDLARQTEKYVGVKTKFTGRVVQIQEIYGRKIILRVNVTKSEYGFYDDTLWVNYEYHEGEGRILENDIIDIWGEIKGRRSYTAVLGNQITIPELDGVKIEIVDA